MSNRSNRKKTPESAVVLKKKYHKRQWRKVRRLVLFLAFVVPLAGYGLLHYKNSYAVSHNLNDIGSGIPVVVQMHDTGCPTCLKLRRHVESALNQVEGNLLFRIADISTVSGRSLQRKFDVPHVTLLLFDGNGELKRTMTGMKDSETLARAFNSHLNRWGIND
jgi:hypothetical protein